MTKTPFAILSLTLLCSCTSVKTTAPIEGAWIQPIPGQQGKTQGLSILPQGKAASINMKTLGYQGWSRHGNTLTLTGKSIGNKQTIDFSNKVTIKKLTADTLELEEDGQTSVYTRKK